jgi:hypothetical protein
MKFLVNFGIFLCFNSYISFARLNFNCSSVLVWNEIEGKLATFSFSHESNGEVIYAANISTYSLLPNPSSPSQTVIPNVIHQNTLTDISTCLSSPPTTLPSRLGFGKRQKISSNTLNSENENATRAIISENGIEVFSASGILLYGICPMTVQSGGSIGTWLVEAVGYGFGQIKETSNDGSLTTMCALMILSIDNGVSIFFNTTNSKTCIINKEKGFVEGMSHMTLSSIVIEGGSLLEISALLLACTCALIGLVAFIPKGQGGD